MPSDLTSGQWSNLQGSKMVRGNLGVNILPEITFDLIKLRQYINHYILLSTGHIE